MDQCFTVFHFQWSRSKRIASGMQNLVSTWFILDVYSSEGDNRFEPIPIIYIYYSYYIVVYISTCKMYVIIVDSMYLKLHIINDCKYKHKCIYTYIHLYIYIDRNRKNIFSHVIGPNALSGRADWRHQSEQSKASDHWRKHIALGCTKCLRVKYSI